MQTPEVGWSTDRSIINDPDASPSDRIRAAELIFDRVLGKPKESVDLNLSGDAPWQRMIAAAIVGTEEQAREVIEAEILDDTLED